MNLNVLPAEQPEKSTSEGTVAHWHPSHLVSLHDPNARSKNRLKDSFACPVQPTTDHRYGSVGLEAKQTRRWRQPTTTN